MRKAYLVMVNPSENNNKFYDMTEQNGQLVAKYGRVGKGTPQIRTYPIALWDKKYKEKLRKGYTAQEMTDVDTNNAVLNGDSRALQFIDYLQKLSNDSFKANYSVSTNAITQTKIDKVQAIINDMVHCTDEQCFNDLLVQVFMIVPRQMKRVDDHIAKSTKEFARIIGLEQDNVDVLSGQIIKKSATTKGQQSINEAYGLNVLPVTKQEEMYLKDLMKGSKDRYVDAFRVVNKKTEKKLEGFVDSRKNKTKIDLFHGSRNQNWWSIANNGLVLRPTNAVITDKMFGYGSYFANKAKKSMGYCSSHGSCWARGSQDHGLLAVYDVHLGSEYVIKKWKYDHKKLTEAALKSLGNYDSVFAPGGYDNINDEYIVYNENQTTIKYLIKFK